MGEKNRMGKYIFYEVREIGNFFLLLFSKRAIWMDIIIERERLVGYTFIVSF